jgi:regulatory protein
MSNDFTTSEIKHKLEHFCAYQDRCHKEVIQKLWSLVSDPEAIDEIVVYLIGENYLNEERFACSFARGKHRIKHWGKIRIVNELKFRNISQYNINTALKEISAEEYNETFDLLAERHWENLRESNQMKKRKKFSDYLLRKGFENQMIYEKLKELENPKEDLN